MSANILIRKEKIRLRTSDEQLALRIRKLINDTLQYELTHMMEDVFAHNASSALYINIEKLQIDLGRVSAHEFEQDFIKQAESKLVKELQKQLHDHMKPVYSTVPEELSSISNIGSASTLFQLNSAAEQEVTALFYFLEKGIFPWWYLKNEQKTPTEILETLPEEGIDKFLVHIVSLNKKLSFDMISRILQRVFLYSSETKYLVFLLRLVKLYNNIALITNVESVIKNAASLGAILSIQEKKIYKHILSFIFQKQDLANENFFTNLLKQIIKEEAISVEALKKNQQENTGLLNNINQSLMDIANSSVPEKKIGQPPQPKEDSVTGFSRKIENVGLEEAIYVKNAGLLLLHPFLLYLFSDSGLLTKSNQFVSETAQHKAAILLYYLQSGQAGYKEWEMPLNKILCGLDYQDVLPNDMVLSEENIQNCENLLHAVVNHWEALKGASIDSLRNTFLLREGKITRKESHWLVQVERLGTDILLDRLPWGYGTIKLPWLDPLIFTEW